MRHFSLIKLLTVSFSITSSDGLATSTGTQHRSSCTGSFQPTSQGQRLEQTLMAASTNACSSELTAVEHHFTSRRQAMNSIVGMCTGLAFVSGKSNALDMDAFMNSQLDADTKNCDPKVDSKCIPKLSSDEAMCKYGQSGDARGEACRRVKESGGKLPTNSGTPVKSLGGAYAM